MQGTPKTGEAYTTAAALKQPLQMGFCGLGCREGLASQLGVPSVVGIFDTLTGN
jgi:hypothetical protein